MTKIFHLDYWTILGLLGQTLFFLRFLIQWIVSEKKNKSIIPISFWYLSICGSLILLLYAITRKDLVFTIGQSTGLIVYIRNLKLLKNEK
ncbi:MAG TPA: lipid-A-disaccharide synthase N-terminal domain-containing protein [bacterium]|nr:lipid-A-disaccharide synthase N-terminal domain-containing protein [bacterium]HOL48826.1 lipid-A-disaccharide synthase N-terminal domain-containing protein [bacterium]HPQ18928.1 lipid-A-disaccharide synthase N-terminal domain-containing protein [bacterium]